MVVTNNFELRNAISEITTQKVKKFVKEQISLIEGLRQKYNHEIVLVGEAVPGKRETFNYTCIQYAFDLVNPPAVIVNIAQDYGPVYPSPEFVQFLIDHVLEELSEPIDNCIAIYFLNGRITHAGKFKDGFITSKWGTAHLWKHRLFEVPITYGNQVRFFKPIDREETVNTFLKYAEEKIGTSALQKYIVE